MRKKPDKRKIKSPNKRRTAPAKMKSRNKRTTAAAKMKSPSKSNSSIGKEPKVKRSPRPSPYKSRNSGKIASPSRNSGKIASPIRNSGKKPAEIISPSKILNSEFEKLKLPSFNETQLLVPGDFVILTNASFGLSNKTNVHAYFLGVDKTDNRKFFQPLSPDLLEDEPYEPDDNYDELFHYKYDGPVQVIDKKQEPLLFIDKLKNNRIALNGLSSTIYEFSSNPGILKNGEIGIINGIVMCVGVVIHNETSGDMIAYHYVKPYLRSQDNRSEIFSFIKDSMAELNWDFNNSKLFLFIQERKEHADEHNDAVEYIISNLETTPTIVNIVDGTIKFSNVENLNSNSIHYEYRQRGGSTDQELELANNFFNKNK
jgi:hypothetical protein